MSRAVETLRAEITGQREKLERLERDGDEAQRNVDELAAKHDRARAVKAQIQSRVQTARRTIAALEAAVAVLNEQLPTETEPEPKPVVSTPEPPAEPPPPLQPPPRSTHSPYRSVLEAAVELDLTSVGRSTLQYAEAVVKVLAEGDRPMMQMEIAEAFRRDLPRGPSDSPMKMTTAQPIVSRCLPLLVRQRRIEPAASLEGRYAYWTLTPPERASGGLGTNPDNFEGKTTRWPTASSSPPRGTHIKLEEGSYEGGKKR